MPEFKRISESRFPLHVLRDPMEPGLIPDCGDHFLKEFDRCYGHLPWGEEPDTDDQPISNVREVEEELYDRFLTAFRIVYPEERDRSIARDLAGEVHATLGPQREFVRRLVTLQHPGLQPRLAAEQIWPKLTDKRGERIDLLLLLLRFGYCPPRAAADLLARGTEGLPEGEVLGTLLPIAKNVAAAIFSGELDNIAPGLRQKYEDAYKDRNRHSERVRLLADKMKNLVRTKWPAGFFDRWMRIHLCSTAVENASRRAFDDFFLWSRIAADEPREAQATDLSAAIPRRTLSLKDNSKRHAAEQQQQHEEWQARLVAIEALEADAPLAKLVRIAERFPAERYSDWPFWQELQRRIGKSDSAVAVPGWESRVADC
jgi:hypothetical protein